MTSAQRRAALIAAACISLLGWAVLMTSFWLPTEFLREAARATALSILIPGTGATTVLVMFWQEALGVAPRRSAQQLRCTDCGIRILNAAGTTIGDQIEGEFMVKDG